MIKNRSVSVIVPVYNEEKTIGPLLKSLVSFNCVDQVICVDDGSTDGTYRKIKKFKDKITLIHYPKNKGKGYALSRGVMAAKGEIIVFFDSDITGLREGDIKIMVNRLLKSKNKMILGNPRGKLLSLYFKSLTGERAFFRADLLPAAEKLKFSGFGAETCLNAVFKKWQAVPLKCRHLEKLEKGNSKQALASYLKEGLEIVREKAKIEGFWSNEIEQQLKSLSRVRTWQELTNKIKDLPSAKLKRIFKKYVLGYAQKIKAFLTE